MPRGTWTCEKKVGGSWIADGTIHRPNDNFRIPKISTQSKFQLADGDNAYVTPSTKYLDQPINFVWYWDDGTVKTKIEGYINNQNDVKITDDLENVYIGRFISIDPVRVSGIDEERYDITVTMEIMPGIA